MSRTINELAVKEENFNLTGSDPSYRGLAKSLANCYRLLKRGGIPQSLKKRQEMVDAYIRDRVKKELALDTRIHDVAKRLSDTFQTKISLDTTPDGLSFSIPKPHISEVGVKQEKGVTPIETQTENTMKIFDTDILPYDQMKSFVDQLFVKFI